MNSLWKIHEPTAIALYQDQFNVQGEKWDIFVDYEHPFLGASLDGVVRDDGIVEV